MSESDLLKIDVKFNGKLYSINSLQRDNTVADLKQKLFDLTKVLPETQKLLGLKTLSNVPVSDDLSLSLLILKPNSKFMLMGSTREDIMAIENTSALVDPDVIDDFDFKEEDINIACLPENIDKVKRRAQAYRPRQLYPHRPGKRLLVLDIDYTIFDHLSPAESVHQLARPYLLEFLRKAYVDYDLVVWSATSMTWILAKLTQLGIIPGNSAAILQRRSSASSTQTGPSTNVESASETPQVPFRVCLLLDSSDMISVHFPNHGVKEVKPLAVIWDNHPQWGPHNTVMVDDIRRNFIMNPQSGLRIRPYRDAHVNHSSDVQLKLLACYLRLVAARETDFTGLNHNHWERYVYKSFRSRRGGRSKRHRNARRGAPRCPAVEGGATVDVECGAALPDACEVGSCPPAAALGGDLQDDLQSDLQDEEHVEEASIDSCTEADLRDAGLKSDGEA